MDDFTIVSHIENGIKQFLYILYVQEVVTQPKILNRFRKLSSSDLKIFCPVNE